MQGSERQNESACPRRRRQNEGARVPRGGDGGSWVDGTAHATLTTGLPAKILVGLVYPVPARRIENVQIYGILQRFSLVGHVGRNAEHLARVHHYFLVVNPELQRAFQDVGDLLVYVTVQRDNAALFQQYAGHHQVLPHHKLTIEKWIEFLQLNILPANVFQHVFPFHNVAHAFRSGFCDGRVYPSWSSLSLPVDVTVGVGLDKDLRYKSSLVGRLKRRRRNSQGVHEPGEKLKGGGRSGQLDDLLVAENAVQRGVESVINFMRRTVQPIGASQPDLLALCERPVFEVPHAVHLLLACAFLLCQSRVGRRSVIAVPQQGHSGGHQFLVPTGQGAVA